MAEQTQRKIIHIRGIAGMRGIPSYVVDTLDGDGCAVVSDNTVHGYYRWKEGTDLLPGKLGYATCNAYKTADDYAEWIGTFDCAGDAIDAINGKTRVAA